MTGATAAKKKHVSIKPIVIALVVALVSLVATAVVLYAGYSNALAVTTSMFVIALAATAALAVTKLFAKLR